MKRRNAILLGLTFLLMLAGYAAWCWRGFYLSPRLVYHDGFIDKPQAKGMVEKWQAEHAGWDDLPFDGMLALRMLRDPWYDYRGSTTAYLELSNNDYLVCRLVSSPYRRRHVQLGWDHVDGTWKLESRSGLRRW